MGTDPFDLFNSHFGMNPFADMQKQMQMMSQHFDNMERSINSSHISPSFGSSTSTNVQYTNNNGKVSTKTVRVVNKNGNIYKEVIEENNGKKKVTRYVPNETKSFIDDEKIKKLKD